MSRFTGPGCYRCGDLGHYVADCPVTPYPAEALPPPARGRAAAPPRLDDKPVPVRCYEPADPELAHSWARDIREAAGWAEPGTDKEVTQTEFARRHGIPPRTETQRRVLAAEQVAESRAARYAELDATVSGG